MINLLRSNLSRTFKSKTFWVCSALYAIYALILPIIVKIKNPAFVEISGAETMLPFDYGFFGMPLQGILLSIMCCIIIGADFNNGIARTKILSGHRRSKIYASNLITSFVIAAAINAVYLLMFIAIALPIFAKITISASDAVWLILDGTLMLFAYSAIITMIVTISKNTTAATIICFSLLFIGMILFQYLNNLISQPPMIENVYINDLGEVVSEIVPNSNMPSKAAKAFYQFLVDLFPSGQSLQLATGADYNNWQMALYSLGIIGATTGAGMIAFNKTDIK